MDCFYRDDYRKRLKRNKGACGKERCEKRNSVDLGKKEWTIGKNGEKLGKKKEGI